MNWFDWVREDTWTGFTGTEMINELVSLGERGQVDCFYWDREMNRLVLLGQRDEHTGSPETQG